MFPKHLLKRRDPFSSLQVKRPRLCQAGQVQNVVPSSTHSHRAPFPYLCSAPLGFATPCWGQGRGRSWARRTPRPKTPAGSPRAFGGEPGGGVRQVRSSPGRRLPPEALGPRSRAQVRRKQSLTKPATPPRRRVHAGPQEVRATGKDG